jgi:hypothetical protein
MRRRVRHLARTAVAVLAVPLVVACSVYGYAGRHQVVPGFVGCRYVRNVQERDRCFARQARHLVDRDGRSRALAEVDAAARRDPIAKASCHWALHGVGERDGRRLARRSHGPGAAVIPHLDLDSICQQGYMHGALIGYADEGGDVDQIVANGAPTCERAGPNSERFTSNCVHAYGHLFTRAGDGVANAVSACGRFVAKLTHPTSRLGDTCVWGALMEDAFAVAKHRTDGTRARDRAISRWDARCDGLPDQGPRLCHGFVPPLVGLLGGNVHDAARACGKLTGTAARAACRESLQEGISLGTDA